MKEIKKLSELIDEELGDAEKYAKLALMYREDMPKVAEMFFALSVDETRHMNNLHSAVVDLINQHKDDPDPRTEGMKVAYDLIHQHEIEKEKGVRMLQSMYREMG